MWQFSSDINIAALTGTGHTAPLKLDYMYYTELEQPLRISTVPGEGPHQGLFPFESTYYYFYT